MLVLAIAVLLPTLNVFADADKAKEAEGEEEAIYTTKQLQEKSRQVNGERKVYHWGPIRLTPYLSAKFGEYPTGDITPSRAFYWGRVLGANGLAFGIRNLTDAIIEGNWFEPVYRNEEEKKYMFDLIKDFHTLYSKYGCSDNFMTVTAHPMLANHAVRPTTDVAQWREWVLEGMSQRAELLKYAGAKRFLIDLEFTSQDKVSTDIQFWHDLGRDIIQAVKKAHPEIEFGFYPGLTGVQYNLEERINPKGMRSNPRTALLQGIYDGRGDTQIFHFVGWSYCATDQCTGTKWWTIRESPFVHDTDHSANRTIYAHEYLLGDDIRYEWGRWTMGGHRYLKKPYELGATGVAMIKLANVPPEALERTWEKFYAKSNVITVWDHGPSWDEEGHNYVTVRTDEEMGAFKQWLAKQDPAYHKIYDTITGKYWIPGSESAGFYGDKKDMFEYIEKDGIIHITGVLDPQFVTYVNLTKELAGRDRDVIPLYSQEDIERAKKYKEKGYFPYQKFETESTEAGIAGYLVPIKKTESVLGHKLDK